MVDSFTTVLHTMSAAAPPAEPPTDDLFVILNILMFMIFFFGVTLTVGRLWIRVEEYRRAGVKPPRLLRRDVILFTGLATPFLAVLIVRAFDFTDTVRGQILWSLGTGIPAIFAVWYWLYYELFRIDRP